MAPQGELDYVMGVSWPRSGHHMLVRLLRAYFGSGFGYCEFYATKPTPPDIAKCCGQMPCAHAGKINLSKNHDFDLDAPKIEGMKYIVQYREFTPSVVSNFELYVRQGAEDSEDSFRDFASREFTRYLRFTNKWVGENPSEKVLVLRYEDFLADPRHHLAKAIGLISVDGAVDQERVEKAIREIDGEEVKEGKLRALRGVGVHAGRDVREFRYYSPQLFEQLANLKLERATTIDTFRKHLGREPAAGSILLFQTMESKQALAAHLKASKEYKLKRRKLF